MSLVGLHLYNYLFHYNDHTKEWSAMIRGNDHLYFNNGVAIARASNMESLLIELELLHKSGKNSYEEIERPNTTGSS